MLNATGSEVDNLDLELFSFVTLTAVHDVIVPFSPLQRRTRTLDPRRHARVRPRRNLGSVFSTVVVA